MAIEVMAAGLAATPNMEGDGTCAGITGIFSADAALVDALGFSCLMASFATSAGGLDFGFAAAVVASADSFATVAVTSGRISMEVAAGEVDPAPAADGESAFASTALASAFAGAASAFAAGTTAGAFGATSVALAAVGADIAGKAGGICV